MAGWNGGSNLPPGVSPWMLEPQEHDPRCDAPRCPECGSREVIETHVSVAVNEPDGWTKDMLKVHKCLECDHIAPTDDDAFDPTTCICAELAEADATKGDSP